MLRYSFDTGMAPWLKATPAFFAIDENTEQHCQIQSIGVIYNI